MSIALESDEYFPNLILDISIFWLIPYFRFYLLASLNYTKIKYDKSIL